MEKKTIGIGTLLIMLIGSGSYVLYENIDFSKPVYYCESKIELGPQYCVRFSNAGTRCYTNEFDINDYKDCSVEWAQITNETNIFISSVSEPEVYTGREIVCSPEPNYGCVPK